MKNKENIKLTIIKKYKLLTRKKYSNQGSIFIFYFKFTNLIVVVNSIYPQNKNTLKEKRKAKIIRLTISFKEVQHVLSALFIG